MAKKLIQKDTGIGGLLSTPFKGGNDKPKLYAIDKFDVDVDIRPFTELTIDQGNITTDTLTFRKLIDLCDNNGIKLNIINGNINLKGNK